MDAEREFGSSDLSRALSRSFALHVAGRVVEALALGWLAAALVSACIALGADAPQAAHVWCAALLAAACAASAAWIEHRPLPREHVRAVDRRLGWNGALVTASDVAGDAGGGTLAFALVRKVGTRLASADLARASLPSTPLALVALLLGAAVLLGARDFAAIRSEREQVLSSTPLGADQRAALADAARTLRSTAAGAAAVSGQEDAGARNRTARALDSAAEAQSLGFAEKKTLAEDLGRLLGEKTLGDTERAALARALAVLGGPSLDAALAGGPFATPNTGPNEAGGSGTLASGDPLGKMGGPDPRTDGSNHGTVVGLAPDGTERGVGSLRWWPARHDAVVEAWLSSPEGPK